MEELEEYLKQREAEREKAQDEIDAELRNYQIATHGEQVEADLGAEPGGQDAGEPGAMEEETAEARETMNPREGEESEGDRY